jgi:hypothetical protein
MNAVTQAPAAIVADQAIFTSVRSAMGEGYRIIAASPGLRAAERAEITRRSPSHASLSRTDPGVAALLAYPLSSGRHCVAATYAAGMEHTSRGGPRVYSHMILLDDKSYRQFECNPLLAHAALLKEVGDVPRLDGPDRLEPLTWASAPAKSDLLRAVMHPVLSVLAEERPVHDRRRQVDLVLQASLSLLRAESVIVAGADDELDLLDELMVTLPMKIRRTLAVSAGLHYSPARQVRLSFVPADCPEAQRSSRGRNVRWLDAAASHALESSPFDRWFDLLRRWLQSGRQEQIERITTALCGDLSMNTLSRIAAICEDLDGVEDADAARLTALAARYARYPAAGEPETSLVRQIKIAAEQRTAFVRGVPSASQLPAAGRHRHR